jgi:hypothetical protein
MKRAALAVLVLSLVAFPTFAGKTPVKGARCLSLEHIRGGWRMEVRCDRSKGVIVMLDGEKYVGDGMFSGWSQAEMKAFYLSLLPKVESGFEVMQLG